MYLTKWFHKLFRSEIANETDRLTALCVQWESKVEDESIPEESECVTGLQWSEMWLYFPPYYGEMTTFPEFPCNSV